MAKYLTTKHVVLLSVGPRPIWYKK